MGDEMGNNNTTSAFNEEDNASEAEKKTFQDEVIEKSVEEGSQKISAAKGNDDDTMDNGLASKDTSERGNEILRGDTIGDGLKGENQAVLTSEAAYHMEESSMASDDATIEPGKYTLGEGSHSDDVEGPNQKVPVASDETTIELGKDRLEEDSHSYDVKGPNQEVPMGDTEKDEKKARGLTNVELISILENDSSNSLTHEDVVIVENQMPPAVEAEDVLTNSTSLASVDTLNALENDSKEGDACEDDENGDHQKHLSVEGEIVQEKAPRIDLDDRTSELQDITVKETKDIDEQGENAIDPSSEDLDALGIATSLSSDDQSTVKDSFSDAEQEITEIIQAERSPNAGLADAGGENSEILLNSSLEGTKEKDNQIDLCLKKNQLVTYDHHLENESSIKQEEENTIVLTSHDVELQESVLIHFYHDEFEVLQEPLFQVSESLQISDLLETSTLPSMDDDISSEKEKETQEKMLCGVNTEGGDGDEFGSSVRYASDITDNSSCISENSSCSLLAKVNHVSDMVDNQFDHEKKCKGLQEDRKLSISGSGTENSQDFVADIAKTYGTTRRSTGECNEEGIAVLALGVYGNGNIDEVEEPKVFENGHQFDVCLDNSKTSDEISTAQVQEDVIMVPEAEVYGLIPGSTVVNCRPEEEENNEEKVLDEIGKTPEALHATLKALDGEDLSKQCSSNVLTSGQNSVSISHIYSHQEDHVSQTKSFTFTGQLASDWKKENGSKTLGTTGNNLDSSNLMVPALDLVDDETFENEGKDHSQQAEEASLKEAEITASKANLPCAPHLNNSIFANADYEAMEGITRSSTESNPDNPVISCLIQKSPSFNLNLRTEATREESDQIALLHQGKTAMESLSNQSSLNPKPCAEYEPHILQHEEMPVEEKIVTMERSYSEKFHAPFLGLLKEEEEAHLLVMPKKQDNQVDTVKEVKEMESASPKVKEKRKSRPSFFISCMCCMTLTN